MLNFLGYDLLKPFKDSNPSKINNPVTIQRQNQNESNGANPDVSNQYEDQRMSDVDFLAGQVMMVKLSGFVLSDNDKQMILVIKPGLIVLMNGGGGEMPNGTRYNIPDNIESQEQVKQLVRNTKNFALSNGLAEPLFATDQEGGRVARIDFTSDAKISQAEITSIEYAQQVGQLRGHNLNQLGIDINLSPVRDCNINPNNILAQYGRSFSTSDCNTVNLLANAYLSGLNSSGVYGVDKHFPGNLGRVGDDPHLTNVTDNTDLDTQTQSNLQPFFGSDNFLLITTHLTNIPIDPNNICTYSANCINLARKIYGKNVIIFSDELTIMQAAYQFGNDPTDNIFYAIKAGHDVAITLADFNTNQQAKNKIMQNIPITQLQESFLRINSLRK